MDCTCQPLSAPPPRNSTPTTWNGEGTTSAKEEPDADRNDLVSAIDPLCWSRCRSRYGDRSRWLSWVLAVLDALRFFSGQRFDPKMPRGGSSHHEHYFPGIRMSYTRIEPTPLENRFSSNLFGLRYQVCETFRTELSMAEASACIFVPVRPSSKLAPPEP